MLGRSRMQSSEEFTVHKLDFQGHEVWRYAGRVLARHASSLTLEAVFDHDDEEFFGLRLQRGDRFVETYYIDRWYNVFAIYDGEQGGLKGWYCNIARPARIEANDLFAEDLALDLIVDRRGKWWVADEAEFEALPITKDDRRRASEALTELQRLASARAGPFSAQA